MFIDEIKSKISPLWEMGFNTPFVQELIKGDLSKEAFERYLQQDSVYLENYVKLCNIAMSKAKTNKEREIIRSLIEFSNNTELQTRSESLDSDSISTTETEVFPETEDYINYIMSFSHDKDNYKLMIVLMNCMLSYDYIFTIAAAGMNSSQNIYYSFVADYTTEKYKTFYRGWIDYMNEAYRDISDYKKNELIKIFEEASIYELRFWDRVYIG